MDLKRLRIEVETVDGSSVVLDLRRLEDRPARPARGVQYVEFRGVDFEVNTPVEELPAVDFGTVPEFGHTGLNDFKLRVAYTNVAARAQFLRGEPS